MTLYNEERRLGIKEDQIPRRPINYIKRWALNCIILLLDSIHAPQPTKLFQILLTWLELVVLYYARLTYTDYYFVRSQ